MKPLILWMVASFALDQNDVMDGAGFKLRYEKAPPVLAMCPARGSDPIHPKREPHVMRLGNKVYTIFEVGEANQPWE